MDKLNTNENCIIKSLSSLSRKTGVRLKTQNYTLKLDDYNFIFRITCLVSNTMSRKRCLRSLYAEAGQNSISEFDTLSEQTWY